MHISNIFCNFAALIRTTGDPESPNMNLRNMKEVRITAVRQTVYNDLMAKYENPIEHTCNIRQGQQWISVNGQCPEGMCPAAWLTMRDFVRQLARGKGNFYDGWMQNPMSAMISCNDGFRPFSFYIEAIDKPKPNSKTEKPKALLSSQQRIDQRVEKLIVVIGKAVIPRRQIVAELDMRQSSRHTFINNYLKPAVANGYVEMANPKSPNTPGQAYRLTAKGIALYTRLLSTTE